MENILVGYCIIGVIVAVVVGFIFIFGEHSTSYLIDTDFVEAAGIGLLLGAMWPITIVMSILAIFLWATWKVVKTIM